VRLAKKRVNNSNLDARNVFAGSHKYPELLEMMLFIACMPTHQTQFLHGRFTKAKLDVN
jgi:hypothetical protein